jgi:hypothetical protein
MARKDSGNKIKNALERAKALNSDVLIYLLAKT